LTEGLPKKEAFHVKSDRTVTDRHQVFVLAGGGVFVVAGGALVFGAVESLDGPLLLQPVKINGRASTEATRAKGEARSNDFMVLLVIFSHISRLNRLTSLRTAVHVPLFTR
jgi:hypothetical protein